MGRRFRALERTIKTKQSTIDNYKAYRAGTVELTRRSVDTLDRRVFFLYPFGLEATALNHTPVFGSGRAFDRMDTVIDAGLTIFNLAADGAEGAGSYISTFEPAKAIITKVGTKAEEREPSQITGLLYTKRNNETFTYPFGQNATGVTYYQEMVQEISEAVETKDRSNTVTFKPERWRQR